MGRSDDDDKRDGQRDDKQDDGRHARKSVLPFVQTVGWTLWASTKVIARATTTGISPAQGDAIMRSWADHVFATGNARLHVSGLEHVVRDTPYVVMTNHQSLLDVPSVVRSFPGRVRMVGKYELGELPVWGHAMKELGVVFVDRGDRKRAIAALERAKVQLRAGTSIWIAPEGTRSHDGALGPLKKGGFHLARQLGVPILPAWIEGTRHIIAPDGWGVVRDREASITYGAPIATTGADVPVDDDIAVPALIERVRAALLALRPA